ncbi:MAG: tRNA (N6-threonylcarbamoyladenosine(37)-N6)-methyltransferase TrmO [Thermoproteota archaeon]|nr:tRNA (N6-threonylcarbamoyladenosine(37)-N6)-methyltransferase TrmO [Thermoproteota archaeon]
MKLELKPIGVVHSSYKSRKETPPQGGEAAEIVIFDEYEGGLKDIEGFSHLHILYWLHKSKGYSLSVRTPWDSKPHGLFTTRTPRRPNPIGHSVVQLIKRKGCVLKVKGLDAIEGTPVLDIKPYIPSIDSKPKAKTGWLEDKITV